jgi:hypothetical protein
MGRVVGSDTTGAGWTLRINLGVCSSVSITDETSYWANSHT